MSGFSGVAHAIGDSIGRRGVLSTAALLTMRLYAANNTVYGIAGVSELVSRVAVCVRKIVGSATTMEGWDRFQNHAKGHLKAVLQPVDKSNSPAGKSALAIAKEAAKYVLVGAAVWDLGVILAGEPNPAFNTVLKCLGPFQLDSKWKGPIASILFSQFPTQIQAVQKLNFYL